MTPHPAFARIPPVLKPHAAPGYAVAKPSASAHPSRVLQSGRAPAQLSLFLRSRPGEAK
jgi:hypothetical protein